MLSNKEPCPKDPTTLATDLSVLQTVYTLLVLALLTVLTALQALKFLVVQQIRLTASQTTPERLQRMFYEKTLG